MVYKDIAIAAERLPLDERLLLVESLMHSVRRELVKTARPEPTATIKLVRGMLKPDGPLPTDAELQEEYTRYLIEKYQ